MNPSGSLTPLVSVITATYNRSNVLRFCIACLQRSTVADWEHIVVGDACTDDTASVVASFGDPRLRFVNLPRNIGEQSGPNNEGCRLARGRYIAFLNHDDLWLPDHLETLLDVIRRRQADLAFGRCVSILPDGERLLYGASPLGDYQPVAEVHASLWLFRRELLDDVGPWRHSRDCWAIPSQDWLIRAWRRKKKIVPTDKITVISVLAGFYRDCYKENSCQLQQELFSRMTLEPDFREREATRAAIDTCNRAKSIRIWDHMKNLARATAYRLLLALRIPPVQVKYMARLPWRGRYMQRLRRFRGLPPVKRQK